MTPMLHSSGSCSLRYQPMVRWSLVPTQRNPSPNPPSQLNSYSVWAIFWILFEIGVLIGFILLGVAVFKRTPDQMRYEAGTSRDIFPSPCTLADLTVSSSPLLAHMTVMKTRSFCGTFDIDTTSGAVLLSHCNCILSVDASISIVTFGQALILQCLFT